VPPLWKTIAAINPGQHPDYEQLYTGVKIIPRVTTFNGLPIDCAWFLPINTGSHGVLNTPGIYVINTSGGIDGWSVQFAGKGPAEDDFAVYDQTAFGFPRVFWRCLNRNRLYRDIDNGGNFVGLPDYIDVEPFWP
jgi:hypothetical protein